jgi:metal-responsive CopG/Arc/MetJ family transcriptional regulator
MAKMSRFTLKLSEKQIRQLTKLTAKLELDRSAVIRLAIARLVEEEANREPRRIHPQTPDPNA